MVLSSEEPEIVPVSSCDREPIHHPGSIQPHGFLLALSGEPLVVRQASANIAELIGIPVERVVGSPLGKLIDPPIAELVLTRIGQLGDDGEQAYLGDIELTTRSGPLRLDIIAHRFNGSVICEFEFVPARPKHSELYAQVRSCIARLRETQTIADVCRMASRQFAASTGFDRALIYRFDADGHGTVVGEARNDRFPTLLNHRFPASDIPAQARALYALNRSRVIPDAGYQPVPLVGGRLPDEPPLDLSFSTLRSVSPIHREYMKNMGTAASMSFSIMRNNELWGLVTCHNQAPCRVPYEVRNACELLTQVLSLQLANLEDQQTVNHRLELKTLQTELLACMSHTEPFTRGLDDCPDKLLAFGRATGAAICIDNQMVRYGDAPDETQILQLVNWLDQTKQNEVFATDQLSAVYPPAHAMTAGASGLLAIALSRLHPSYLLWFRPEVVRVELWGGNPHKPAVPGAHPDRLNPRSSFDLWKETVQRQSEPWDQVDIDAATELRHTILGIVLRTAEERAELTQGLEQSNRELEAFSYSVSHDLRAPFRHIIGYAELLTESESDHLSSTGKRYIETIIESAHFAGELVDNLLTFSQMGRQTLNYTAVDMHRLIDDVRMDLSMESAGRSIDWIIGPLPVLNGDAMMLRQGVRNLLANAVKYTRSRSTATIEITAGIEGNEVVFAVRDNGVGFDMKYADKLFGVFQRLHRMEDYEGTGIGLANVHRIVTRHGGRVWAEAKVDKGATFYMAFPVEAIAERNHG